MSKNDDRELAKAPDGFRPLNDDHAVKNVVFSLSFDQQLLSDDIQRFVDSHPNLRSELPCVRGINSEDQFGVSFSYLRPDGTAIWIAKLSDYQIDVECTRYTRWNKIAEQALSYINTACKALIDRQPKTNFSLAKLQFIDKFVNRGRDYNLRSLLKSNEFVAEHVFESGESWHSETGWFQSMESDFKVLNRVNVGAVSEDYLDETGTQQSQFSVKIDHFQETRSIQWEGTPILGYINPLFDILHKGNKEIVTQLLSEKIQSEIGLWSKNEQ